MAIGGLVKVIASKFFSRDSDLQRVSPKKTHSECVMKSAAWEGYFAQRIKKRSSQPVSRVLSWTVIHLGRASPRASSDLPGSRAGRTLRSAERAQAPLFGLAPSGVYRAASCYQSRGALLPHLFTLTGAEALRRCIFCGTVRRLAPPRRYLAPCPEEPGLSSARCAATAWLTRAAFYHRISAAAGR